jgi:peroxiredoxin
MAARQEVLVDRFGILLIASLVLAALGGCDNQLNASAPPAQVVAAKPAAEKTVTTALPEKTNNAWEMAPFSLKDLDGKQHSLDEWKGKVIMMNFWASWCSPCQYEIPEFVLYQREFGGKNLQIVGIGVDDRRKLANVARSLGINYPVLVLAPQNARGLMRKWGNETGIIPYTVVIAADGRIKYIHRGQMSGDDFNEYVLPLLD